MAFELEPWVQVVRGCCGATVLVIAITPNTVLKVFGIGRTIPSYGQHKLFSLFVALSLIYAVAFAGLVAEAVARNSLPSFLASISETALVLATFINTERLSGSEDKSPIHLVRATSWCFLCAVELFIVAWISLPGSQTSPSFALRVSAAINICKLATCIIFLVHILPMILENHRAASEPDPSSPFYASSNPDDILGLQTHITQEVEMVGGWWPFLKQFGVFFKYMLPVGKPLQLFYFLAAFLLMLTHEVAELREQLAFASILDAATAGLELKTSLKKALTLRAVNIALCYIYEFVRARAGLHRAETFATGVHAKILSMDPTFHSLTNPTVLTMAADDSRDFANMLDTIIFSHFTNIIGIAIAAIKLVSLHGPFLLIILSYQITFTCAVNHKGVQKRAKAHANVHKSKTNQERRRQDGLRGWTTLFNNNLIEHEIVSFCGLAAGYSFIIYQNGHGTATVGDLMLFTSVWAALWMRIGDLTRTVPELVDALLDAAPLRRVLERGSALQTSGAELRCREGSLKLCDVSFAYPGREKTVVDHLSLSIEPGTKVSLIGPSGTGKSTLLKLCMRYLTPSNGVILIDGQDISKIPRICWYNSSNSLYV
ncbi:uncharacterized protein PgNI_11512 [Pyricularia grisea]|uniref:ABC transporter domain-containing protein n=1 Tax=Pyricularia grisea TaxID=148305 RepID=A0A6P8AP25_PYRGI|nr:uncharacterized protein PgNI_11512 [Pyricularia grisea]TLD03785.1 hypothetical protein PgNI_11512 [Pyricularia grisea]